MRRLLVWLLVALVLVAGGWWVRGTPRRSASSEPLPADRVAQEAPRPVELVAPDPAPVQESVTETPASSPERVEVDLESSATGAILRVQVFDARGELWLEPTRIPADRGDFLVQGLGRRQVRDWPDRVVVLVFARDDLEGVGTAVGASLKRASGPEGAFEYEVVEGARYLVGAIGPGFDGSLREVDVPRGKDRVVVDLHAQDLGELALLSVRVFHRGRELDGGMDEDPFALQLEGREGNVLLSVPCDVLRAPFQLRAPAGDYRLVVEGRAGTNFPHGYVERVRLLGRCERVLRLVAGDRQEVELEIGEGAKLEVTLVGQAEDADVRAAWEGASPGARMEEVQDREAERRSALAQLYLVADDRRREPVLLLTRAMEGTSAGGLHLLDQWPLGETSVSECLSAGRHTLIARLPGGREARAEVDLREGRTTPVRLHF